jgi:hypothetical protein
MTAARQPHLLVALHVKPPGQQVRRFDIHLTLGNADTAHENCCGGIRLRIFLNNGFPIGCYHGELLITMPVIGNAKNDDNRIGT